MKYPAKLGKLGDFSLNILALQQFSRVRLGQRALWLVKEFKTRPFGDPDERQ
jgi:hypothetical protein